MMRQRSPEHGQIVLLAAFLLTTLTLLAGLSVDMVLAYVARARMVTAVDSVAVASMRALNLGASYPEQELEVMRVAEALFEANFPDGLLMSGSTPHMLGGPVVHGQNIPAGVGSIFQQDESVAPGVRELRLVGEAKIPTFFMRMLGIHEVTVRASAVVARRDVNVMLVLDRSGSLFRANAWDDVQQASAAYLNYFDNNSDRLGVVTFGANARVDVPLDTGFRTNNMGENAIMSQVALNRAGTNAALGLWLAYAELLRIGNPNALNVITFFTDGQPTAYPAKFDVRTIPIDGNDPACNETEKEAVIQTVISSPWWDINGFWELIAPANPVSGYRDGRIVAGCDAPDGSFVQGSQNNGSETEFLFAPDGCTLEADWQAEYGNPAFGTGVGCDTCGVGETFQRTFGIDDSTGSGIISFPYSSTVCSSTLQSNSSGSAAWRGQQIHNQAKNLALNIAKTARQDPAIGGAVIYSIGLGGAGVTANQEFLLRVANDETAVDFNINTTDGEKEGDYIFAPSTAELNAAFEKVRSHVMRITQ